MFTDSFAMTTELTVHHDFAEVSQVADNYARRARVAAYAAEMSDNTWRSKQAAMRVFAQFLATLPTTAPSADDLLNKPESWKHISFGLVSSFKEWLLAQGYSVGTVNSRLTSVRTLAHLAFEAGHLQVEQATLIAGVKSISRGGGLNLDAGRVADGVPVRIGAKKAEHTKLSAAQRTKLKTAHDDTPQGRRDRVMMCLLLDHGLRVSEVVGVTVGKLDMTANTLVVYRKKTKKWQTLELSNDTQFALLAYINAGDCPAEPEARLLRSSLKSGALAHAGMTESGCAARVAELGLRLGIQRLSPHDCRHSFATMGAKLVVKGKASILQLQEAGGWSSLAMVRRYVEGQTISNTGLVNVDDMS